ncbi:TonB-dependent receptor [Filimonas zeae]|uniref:TonB-dependent receptor n=2 Tax=Filimonas zeae TaxID=1737353 RepID=A0A917J1H1_9BACT|nr:TonB-dependent receptor [Filimonas zeae]
MAAYGQTGTGKISGKVLSSNNQPIVGATIKAIESAKGTRTDIDGRYLLTLPTGKYTITISALSYAAKSIEGVEVSGQKITDLDMVLDAEVKNLDGITVRSSSSAKKETVSTAILFQKNTNTVAQVVSAEAIKRSPDRNTSEVLKRVSGASIQDGKFIVVRGLSDRYNQATLNGALLNSTEPDRKTFAFDIFPSNILDNIIVNKAAVPELPGEFAGGLIQLNTKDAVDKSFLTAVVGGGFNSQAVSNPFYTYKGGKTDWLGVDDGTRKLPGGLPDYNEFNNFSTGKRSEYGQLFNNNWGYHKRGGLINKNFQLTGGRVLYTNGVRRISAIASVSYNEQFRNYNKINRFTEGDGSVRFNYVDNFSADNLLLGGIVNVSYQSSRFKLSLKNSYNITSTDHYMIRTGIDNSNQAQVNLLGYQSAFKSNRLWNSQLNGEHLLGAGSSAARIKWNANIAVLNQKLPDMKNLAYNENEINGVKTFVAQINDVAVQPDKVGRFFSDLSDKIYGVNGDFSKPFNLGGNQHVLKVGAMAQRKDRDFNSRVFAVRTNDNNTEVRFQPIDQIFNSTNFASGKLYMYDVTSASNNYDAFVNLFAGYIQFDNKIADKIKISWGARVEKFEQEVSFMTTTVGVSRTNNSYTDFLPSLNLNYSLNNKTNLRLSGSRTVARPEFREIAAFSFFDFERNVTIQGNSFLKRTKITNLDARYELYPQAGELFTLGVFYKHFVSPIESSYNFASGSPQFTYTNAKSADNYGVEFEFRKKLDFISLPVVKDITAFANLALIDSKVTFDANVADQLSGRPMQGQSPIVVNAGLQYVNDASKSNASILFNRIGRRIATVGFPGFGNIYEAPRSIIDFQFTQALARSWELKLTVSDLLNQKANFYQDNNGDKKYSADKDNLFNSMNYGVNFGANLTYTF